MTNVHIFNVLHVHWNRVHYAKLSAGLKHAETVCRLLSVCYCSYSFACICARALVDPRTTVLQITSLAFVTTVLSPVRSVFFSYLRCSS